MFVKVRCLIYCEKVALFRRLCSRTRGACPRVSRPVLHDGLHCGRSKLGYTNLSLFEYFSHAVAEVAIKWKCLYIDPLEVNNKAD